MLDAQSEFNWLDLATFTLLAYCTFKIRQLGQHQSSLQTHDPGKNGIMYFLKTSMILMQNGFGIADPHSLCYLNCVASPYGWL